MRIIHTTPDRRNRRWDVREKKSIKPTKKKRGKKIRTTRQMILSFLCTIHTEWNSFGPTWHEKALIRKNKFICQIYHWCHMVWEICIIFSLPPNIWNFHRCPLWLPLHWTFNDAFSFTFPCCEFIFMIFSSFNSHCTGFSLLQCVFLYSLNQKKKNSLETELQKWIVFWRPRRRWLHESDEIYRPNAVMLLKQNQIHFIPLFAFHTIYLFQLKFFCIFDLLVAYNLSVSYSMLVQFYWKKISFDSAVVFSFWA